MQKRLVLVCEGSLCSRKKSVLEKLPDVSGPGLVEAGRYRAYPSDGCVLRAARRRARAGGEVGDSGCRAGEGDAWHLP